MCMGKHSELKLDQNCKYLLGYGAGQYLYLLQLFNNIGRVE